MAQRHFVIRRSRLGRFNFALLTSAGRLTRSVTVPVEGRSNVELRQQAMEQIRVLAEDFARVQDGGGRGRRQVAGGARADGGPGLAHCISDLRLRDALKPCSDVSFVRGLLPRTRGGEFIVTNVNK